MSSFESSVDGPPVMDVSDSDTKRERLIASWRLKVMIYKDNLTSVRPMLIMRKMRLLCTDHPVLDKVFQLDLDNRTAEASETFINYLLCEDGLDRADVVQRWVSFDKALKEVNNWVHDIVNGLEDPSKHQLQKNLINFFMEEICERVNPAHIISHLRQLLGDIEFETLLRTLDNSGPTLAATYMVGHLPYSTNRDWFKEFQRALMMYYADLAELLDDKSYESLTNIHEDEDESMELKSFVDSSQFTDEQKLCHSRNKNSMEDVIYTFNQSSKGLCDTDLHLTIPKRPNIKPETTSLSPLVSELGIGDKSLMSALDDAPSLSSMSSDEVAANMVRKLDQAMENRDRTGHNDKELPSKDMGLFHDLDIPKTTSNSGHWTYTSEELKKIRQKCSSYSISNHISAVLQEMGIARDYAEMSDEEVADISLRPYQTELAHRPLSGQNVIICAPTGSGKTQVALKIMMEHLQQSGQGVRKTVFLVNQVALAEQQYNQCRKHLPGFRCKCVTGSTGDTEKVPLKHLLMGADVLVMTAQILLDALDRKEMENICQFSLIVFDECHHTNQRHPFNCLMHHYMAVKYANNNDQDIRLPQVVGLTASVGVGKANTDAQACNHIKKLCAHLDAEYICTVKNEVEQLARFTNEPTYDLHVCTKRQPDLFQDRVERIMKTIEEWMQQSENKKQCPEIGDKLNPPRQRGTSQYTGWASQLRKDVAKLRDPKSRRFYESARRMLEFYNTSLVINDECDTEDAFSYLKNQVDITNDSIGQGQEAVDIKLKELFDENTSFMEQVSHQQANTNPKLIKLELLLTKAFTDEPESRTMVFVKTRDLASALLHWMRRRPRLLPLKPGKMVGAGASVDSGGMTKNQQVDVMQYFRDGDHKVMIATSVAEEGLDIRKCNLVIRYNHVTNEIAMVQTRGRARAENSQFVTLAGEDKGVQAKDEINFIREMMMRDAIKQLQLEMDLKPTEFRHTLEQIQREEKSLRDIELQQRNGRQKREREVDFRCRKCDEFAFMSSDLRKIENMHHVVIDLDFRERHNEKPVPRPKEYGNIEIRGKLMCKNCGDEWGKSILYQKVKFPVVSVSGFVLTDEFDRKDAPKKWKQVNFHIQPLEMEELEAYRRQASAVGYTDD